MLRKLTVAAAVTLLSAGTVATLTTSASADEVGAVSPDVLSAMQRDLNLTATEAKQRLVIDSKAAQTEQTLRGDLGASYAGTWLDATSNEIVVAVTDSATTGKVTAAGARPQVVTRSEGQLNATKESLDAVADRAPKGVAGWFVDVRSNSIVLTVAEGSADAAKTFVAGTGADASAVRVEVSTETPQTLYDVRGGDAYYMGGGRCSIGFSVVGGYVTAGHCGRPGTATQGSNRVASGSFAGSSFPGNDYAWVRTNSNWVPRGVVNRYNGGTVAVRGSTASAVGASICRSGSTTGWRCGTVQSKNQTVRYPQGSVAGLTRTNACAEPGDSGGSWLSGNQAQGVTSGGSGNCSSGGTTYFQPVGEILSAYGLRLVTS